MHKLLRVLHPDHQHRPTSPDFDILGCLHFLEHKQWLTSDQPISLIFIGCGGCLTETALVEAMAGNGYTIASAVFMDPILLNDALQNVQSLMKTTGIKDCFLTDHHAGILRHLHSLQGRGCKALMLGVHAGLSFASAEDASDFSKFLTSCQGLANEGLLQPEFTNFHQLGKGTGTAMYHPIEDNHCLWVYHCKWSTQAQTGKGAKAVSQEAAKKLRPDCTKDLANLHPGTGSQDGDHRGRVCDHAHGQAAGARTAQPIAVRAGAGAAEALRGA